ncbi:RbsD/FucU domain-containing protein [Streptomyces sp. NPDC058240]|uniref:RbsD/FucU domain-containing protein n=1 Tax=Streptomyces sp. NPDC058240 TaxID=3346396 RepID=UPI0036E8D2BF
MRNTLRPAVIAPAAVLAVLAVGALAFAPQGTTQAHAGHARDSKPGHVAGSTDWQHKLKAALPSLGHRNWIVVADSAYPQQTSPGVKTIVTGAHQVDVVKDVVDLLGKQQHVKAHVQLDKELNYVPENSAPGISRYRKDLDTALAGQNTERLLHEDLIGKLDDAGKEFSVIVLKTDLTLPYTSVFFELDAKYWDADREADLRKRMGS